MVFGLFQPATSGSDFLLSHAEYGFTSDEHDNEARLRDGNLTILRAKEARKAKLGRIHALMHLCLWVCVWVRMHVT